MVSVRRAVIFVAQILALISIVIATVAGALAGEDWLARRRSRACRRHWRACGRTGALYRGRPRRLFHFDNSGGAIFFMRRNREQHGEIHSIPKSRVKIPSVADFLIRFKRIRA